MIEDLQEQLQAEAKENERQSEEMKRSQAAVKHPPMKYKPSAKR